MPIPTITGLSDSNSSLSVWNVYRGYMSTKQYSQNDWGWGGGGSEKSLPDKAAQQSKQPAETTSRR